MHQKNEQKNGIHNACDIGAIVLAGGKSSRMGEDKGLVLLNGKRMVEHVVESLLEVSNEVIIIANNPAYSELNYKVYGDIFKDAGPIGGIYTGLSISGNERNFILSCDIPFVSQRLLKYLANNSGDEEILITKHNEKVEPLCGIYRRNCLNKLEMLLKQNKLKVQEALSLFDVRILDVTCLDFFTENLFMNINTKEQLHIAGGAK